MSSTEINPNAKVSVRDLNLYYGDFHALKGLNIDIPAKLQVKLPSMGRISTTPVQISIC